MQDKNLNVNNDNEKDLSQQQTDTTENIIEDGVVYVQNEDGTTFDTSERTYVAVEGLDEALENEDKKEEDKEG